MIRNIIDEISCKTKIPKPVIYRHVIPYTYRVQCKELLRDIRTYKQDYQLINDIYFTQYNENILFIDLLIYCEYSLSDKMVNEKMENILHRHIMLKTKNGIDLYDFMVNICREENQYTRRNSNLLFGLLTPDERTEFINNYVIDNMTV